MKAWKNISGARPSGWTYQKCTSSTAGGDEPGADCNCKNSAQNLASSNVYVLWDKAHGVICKWDTISSDIGSNVAECEEEAGKEFSWAIVEQEDD
jgi:hypothetical protein